jgi:tRNA dimethylallyltransferase
MTGVHRARPFIVCVVGPTAAGKTDLSLDIAERLDGEIVSADSMQVYRGMDIGTAKLPVGQRRGIPHHLIDIVPPTHNFTAHEYVMQARVAIDTILSRGRTPVVVGGTGLYIKAIVDHLDFTRTARDDALRQKMAA